MDHGHDMPGMGGMTPSSTMNNTNSTGGGMMMHHHKMMMHMTFFWGENAEILFSGWPGARTGIRLIKPGSPHVTAGLIQTLLHTMRVGLAYLVMLAVMSFNGGVFLVAVAGHCLGFLIFGSRVFKKTPPAAKTSDLPPMSC
ncbi:copper transporter, putative [Ricinus communis]|uniref:Copper transport protein n=1 Tax=Ricinus communis TaxID=3988 RepID=B9S3A0_RICCO|nr:copper transporter, putative [Ricinus communis]